MLSREVLARAHRVGTDIDVRKMAIRGDISQYSCAVSPLSIPNKSHLGKELKGTIIIKI